VKDLIELIAKKLVAHPDDVQVTVVEAAAGTAAPEIARDRASEDTSPDISEDLSDDEDREDSEERGEHDERGERGASQVIELRVNPEDMGRLIGKSGRTAKAIRTILSAAASKADVRVSLQIIE
jgi:predicted RNA-binding protein YlqC (UPF0109 family)